jgi:hypothetical protein
LNAGNARKPRNIPSPRWIARVSVSLSTPQRSAKGSGDAIHNWNSDQHTATANTSCATKPVAARPPVSLSATSVRSASGAFSISVATGAYLIQPFSL